MRVPSVLTEPPHVPARVVLALGANLGDRRAALQAAVDALAGYEGVRVVAVSSIIETAPVGGPEQPDYLNAVVLADTVLAPLDLLAVCQQIENDLGRRRGERWGPRTLDVDLIAYQDLVASSSQLVVPHPRAAVRAFVLAPWLELDPRATLPAADGEPLPVKRLLRKAADRKDVRPAAVAPLVVPR
ncbi:MAG TPA: 2-amino-4-hydroxy-6-hydroxymethyldihydropteridine diphosphokinase [Kineosporiaceae bacterium]